jgi:putative ABC transport system ATP-binding protein
MAAPPWQKRCFPESALVIIKLGERQTGFIMTSSTPSSVLLLEEVTFAWRSDQVILSIPQFEMRRGERVFLRGPSGSGKSTLLSLISGVLTPKSGKIQLLGTAMDRARASQRDALRARELGVIFQMFNLVPYLSVLENVALPCRFSLARGLRAKAAGGSIEGEASRLLARLGLGEEDIRVRKATDLSVGQQQRVAAARALIGGPSLILADEPTSALDTEARSVFIDLLSEECAARGSSLLFVSHDLSLAPHFDRMVDLTEINIAYSRVQA